MNLPSDVISQVWSAASTPAIRTQARIRWFVSLALLILLADRTANAANPITSENSLANGIGGEPIQNIACGTGTVDYASGGHSVEGFANKNSLFPGEAIEFYVSADPPGSVTLSIYRVGWYQGQGSRLVSGPTSLGNTSTKRYNCTSARWDSTQSTGWPLQPCSAWIFLRLHVDHRLQRPLVALAVRFHRRAAPIHTLSLALAR
jgi:hypothetical protein